MFDGIGDAAELERICAGLAQRCGVQVLHAGAGIAMPDQVAAMVRDAEARLGRLAVPVAADTPSLPQRFIQPRCTAAGRQEPS